MATNRGRSAADHSEKLQQAIALARQGKLREAERLYEALIAENPAHFDALHCLGILRLEQGRSREALQVFDAALAAEPTSGDALSSLATAFINLNRPDQALAAYDRLLAIKPGDVDALYNRGFALCNLGRPEEAIETFKKVLAIRSDHPPTLFNLGGSLMALGRHDEALVCFNNVLALAPGHVASLNNRGNALSALGRYDEALASYENVLASTPDHVNALNNYANILMIRSRQVEAVIAFDKLLAIRPQDFAAWTSRGLALNDLARWHDAIVSFDRALTINSSFAPAHRGRGTALFNLRRFDEAHRAYDRALAIDPELDYLKGAWFSCLMHLGRWENSDQHASDIIGKVKSGARVIDPLSFMAFSDSSSDHLTCARIFSTDRFPAARVPVWNRRPYSHPKIRVGYVSADFRDHVVSYMTVGLFESHDRHKFEIMAFALRAPQPGAMRERLVAAFDQFIEVHDKSDHAVAETIGKLEIDILVDLGGFTSGSRTRIFALRAAPVQVSYLGYPGSMGSDYYDYIIADDVVIPESDASIYAEKVVYLPGYLVNDSRREIADQARPRAELLLPDGAFVFCCLTATYKIRPAIFDIWMRLLGGVENSVLWLTAALPEVERNLRAEAAARGVDPSRLVFAPFAGYPHAQYLANYRAADLFLDTLPMTAGATAADALWAGLPVVTCTGSTFAGRIAGSQLKAAGLPELVTSSFEEYEALALGFARDPRLLAAVKAKLARQRETCLLFDTVRQTRHIEAAYEKMWKRSRQNVRPQSFFIEPRRND